MLIRSFSFGANRISPSRIRNGVTFVLVFLIVVTLIHRKNEERCKLGAEVKTGEISRVLGTRITAVRVVPDKNTTLMQPSKACQEDGIFGVVLIKSVPGGVGRRNRIRRTWKNFGGRMESRVEVYFFIGLPFSEKNRTDVEEEQRLYNDLIVEDLEEHYYLLAVKTLRMLKWFSMNCIPRAEYLIKTDDDMFLNLPNLVSHVNSVPNQWVNYIGGQIHLRDPVDTNPESKWFAPGVWWEEQFYPPFVSGALTVLASEAVRPILRASLSVPLFHLEDVFLIGMVAFEQLGFMPNDIPRIESNSPEWIVRIKMAFSWEDMAKTYIAFHCPNDPYFMEELYKRSIE